MMPWTTNRVPMSVLSLSRSGKMILTLSQNKRVNIPLKTREMRETKEFIEMIEMTKNLRNRMINSRSINVLNKTAMKNKSTMIKMNAINDLTRIRNSLTITIIAISDPWTASPILNRVKDTRITLKIRRKKGAVIISSRKSYRSARKKSQTCKKRSSESKNPRSILRPSQNWIIRLNIRSRPVKLSRKPCS